MYKSQQEKLEALGTKTLADALLNLSVYSDESRDLVEQLLMTPEENLKSYKSKLLRMKSEGDFFEWNSLSSNSWELELLILHLRDGVKDPLTGVKMLEQLYEQDEDLICRAEEAEDMFSGSAKDLFVSYAKRCSDKEKVVEIVLRLNQEVNYYKPRLTLLECAAEYLSEEMIRTMIVKLQKWVREKNSEKSKRHYWRLIQPLARQVRDIDLLKESYIALGEEHSSESFFDLAYTHLQGGQAEVAHALLDEITRDEKVLKYQKDALFEEICRAKGEIDNLSELLFEKFQAFRSEETLENLLEVLGEKKRDEVIADATKSIFETKELSMEDANFFLSLGMIDETEEYLLERRDQLVGMHYRNLGRMADEMAAENRSLIAILLYRASLLFILKEGRTHRYPDGVRFLRELDQLEKEASKSKELDSHHAFREALREKHGRKHSFWSKYGKPLSTI